MKISIITVCYNSVATIADTLRSVVNQTHADIECIVIDGGSTDGTLALVRKWGRPDTVIVSEPDRGIYDAMNKGLRLATGDMVGFLNADDIFANETVVSDIAKTMGDGADVVYGDLVYVAQKHPDRVVRHWRSGQFKRLQLGWGWMPPHPTFYFRRSLVEKLGGFDTGFRIAADYDFMLRYLREIDLKIMYLPRVLVKMRTGGISNHSLKAILRKSREDYSVLRKNGVGGWVTLACKNLRKLSQLIKMASPKNLFETRKST